MQRSRISREIQWLLKEKYHGRLTPLAKKDIAQLQKGEHVDYVIGFVEFLRCTIDLSKKPFIPRPETEYWVGKVIQSMLGNEISNNRSSKSLRDFGNCTLGSLSSLCSEPCQTTSEGLFGNLLPTHRIRCLDLFAGSGCIGVAILKRIPQVAMDFGEKNKRMLSQIRLNAKTNEIEKKRYRVVRSDVFSAIKRKYDYIFANPPYIPEKRKARVQESVLKEEPHTALFGGKDGLRYIRKFLGEARKYLNPGGKIYLEFDSPQKGEIEKLLKKYGYGSWEFHKDQYDKWRFFTSTP